MTHYLGGRTTSSNRFDFDECQAVAEATEFISYAVDVVHDGENASKVMRILVATDVVRIDVFDNMEIPITEISQVKNAVSAAAALIEKKFDLFVCDLAVFLDHAVQDICRRINPHCRIALLTTWGGEILDQSDLLSESDRIISMERARIELPEFIRKMSAQRMEER